MPERLKKGKKRRSSQEKKVREDKKVSFTEEQQAPQEVIPIQALAPVIDEENNQAGPSRLSSPSTPRPSSQKNLAGEGREPDPKKLKPTVEKSIHPVEVENPEPKRSRHEEGDQMERRISATQVGENLYYHNDAIWDEEKIEWNLESEEEESFDGEKGPPDELWLDAPLDRVPPDPPGWVDDLADTVEEGRLQKMGALKAMAGPLPGHKTLTTRFVHDWRAKPRPGMERKQWLRRSRMVAREYANEKNDEVHSPASGGQALRLLPLIYRRRRRWVVNDTGWEA